MYIYIYIYTYYNHIQWIVGIDNLQETKHFPMKYGFFLYMLPFNQINQINHIYIYIITIYLAILNLFFFLGRHLPTTESAGHHGSADEDLPSNGFVVGTWNHVGWVGPLECQWSHGKTMGKWWLNGIWWYVWKMEASMYHFHWTNPLFLSPFFHSYG